MSGVGNREVAHRLFAAEYDDASLEYAESDEERAPNYVVTPTGARVNRLFVVGVLTSVEQVNEDTVRARIADPTGAFVVYAGQYQPDEHAALQSIDPPAFVAVTGKANTFQPDGSDRILTSVRPESVTEVDAAARDRWVVSAAEHTLARIATVADALEREERGDGLAAVLRGDGLEPGLAEGVARSIDHYDTTPDYLGALREVVLQAVEVVSGDRDEADALDLAPEEGTGEYTTGDLRDAAPESESALTEAAGPVEELAESEAADDDGGSDVESGTEPDADTAAEPDTEAGTEPETDEVESRTPDETEPTADAAEAEPSDTDAESGETGDGAATEPDEAEEPAEAASDTDEAAAEDVAGADADVDEELYEVDEEERERIEEEYGVGFESGTEVGEPGEAGIDAPDPEETTPDADPEGSGAAESGADASDDSGEDADGEGAEEGAADEAAADADLDDVLVAEMERLDEGDGADRETLAEAVADETGADPDAVADAIEDALMSGKCYEPSEGTLKPI